MHYASGVTRHGAVQGVRSSGFPLLSMALLPDDPAPPRSPAEDDLRRRVKRELRKRAQELRKATPLEACHARSLLIVANIHGLEAMHRARSVALFWPIVARHEVDLRSLDVVLRERGVRVAYPAIVPRDDGDGRHSMTFRFVSDVSTLAERGFGFAEPPLDAPGVGDPTEALDVIILPALALDPAGQRIGYGAGYYDRALKGTKAVKVGVIFDFQLLSEIPATTGDVPVCFIVSDRRVLSATPSAREPEGPMEPPCPT